LAETIFLALGFEIAQLLRLSDLYQYYWTVFRGFPCDVYSPCWISDEDELQSFVNQLKTLPFRGRFLISIDVERVSIWPPTAPNVPTHSNCVNPPFARWITVANPYGLIGFIDCSVVTQQAFKIFEQFLLDEKTTVIMFDSKQDLWSIHVTYGEVIPGTPLTVPIPKNLKNCCFLAKGENL